jgi:uncharacterized protein with PIN domain
LDWFDIKWEIIMIDEIVIQGRLNGIQRNRLFKLLEMFYTPAELAQEIGFTTRQVYRVYIPAGCPHEKDQNKRIWINGKAFKEWYFQTYKKVELRQDETFCLTCRKAVKVVKPERRKKERLVYDVSLCPDCGRKLAKIINKEKRGQ